MLKSASTIRGTEAGGITSRIKALLGVDSAGLSPQMIERAMQVRQQALALPEVAEYLRILTAHADERQNLVDELVVSETWFFREEEAIEAMVRIARQRRRAGAGGQGLRILSVPCAGGEEPYSLAMALLDAGFSPDDFSILAADISRRSLRNAQRGWFLNHSFRGLQLRFRERHFIPAEGGYQLASRVMSCVRFHHDNLLSSLFLAKTEPVDFLFCRNLFIYLEPEMRKRAVARLAQLLKPDGYLFCGASEYRCFADPVFRLERLGYAYAYRPKSTSSTRPGRAKSLGRRGATWEPSGEETSRDSRVGSGEQVIKERDQGCREELHRARCLANEGRLVEGATICERLLRQSAGGAEGFSLLALIREGQGRIEDAMQLHRKALYLDPHHYESLIHLALLREQLGDAEEAGMLRHRAERVIRTNRGAA